MTGDWEVALSVTYSLPELRRRLVGSGGPLQFVTTADPQVALEVFRAAAQKAEEPSRAGAMDGEDFVGTSSYAPLPRGPIGYMHTCDNADLLSEWLTSVAAQLDEAGLHGRLAYLRGVDGPIKNAPTALAGISLNVDLDRLAAEPFIDGNPPAGWWVDQDTTQRAVSKLVEWCLEVPGEQVWVFAGTGFWMPTAEGVADLASAAVGSTSQVMLARVSPDGDSIRYVALGGGGAAVCGIRDEQTAWDDQMHSLQELLKAVAPDVTHALTRLGPPVVGLDRLWMVWPKVPYVEERSAVHSRMNGLAHLQVDYVPDAYAFQVMTTRQLDKINATGGLPAERWTVEDLGAGRWLVAARDPAPWLDLDPIPYTRDDNWATRRAVPDPNTLAQARADFAPALLTHQLQQDHPRPTPQ